MRTATDLLSQYAAYHRDRRNIVSHLVGVPLIVFAVGVLLARPALTMGGLAITPAWVAFGFAALWYLTISAILSIIQYYVERHFGRGFSNQRLRRPGRSARRAALIPTEETS